MDHAVGTETDSNLMGEDISLLNDGSFTREVGHLVV